MKEKYIGINCSKCGRWVGKDGFYDYNAEDREIGYPLCKRCLDAQGPTIYDCERELREIGTPSSRGAKERVKYLKETIENIRRSIR